MHIFENDIAADAVKQTGIFFTHYNRAVKRQIFNRKMSAVYYKTAESAVLIVHAEIVYRVSFPQQSYRFVSRAYSFPISRNAV